MRPPSIGVLDHAVDTYTARCCESLRRMGYPYVFATGRWPAVREAGVDALHQWCYDNLSDFEIHAEIHAVIAIENADEALAFKMRWR